MKNDNKENKAFSQTCVMQSVLKASDLRIENLLIYDNEIRRICSIHSDNTIRFNDKEKGSIGCFSLKTPMIKPILLTEEWLLKFGFENKYGCYVLSTPRGTISIEEDLAEISSVITHNGFQAPCGYVHELQNLYFALTQRELTVA